MPMAIAVNLDAKPNRRRSSLASRISLLHDAKASNDSTCREHRGETKNHQKVLQLVTTLTCIGLDRTFVRLIRKVPGGKRVDSRLALRFELVCIDTDSAQFLSNNRRRENGCDCSNQDDLP